MSEVLKVVNKIKEKPYIIDMGAKKIASWLKVSSEAVREAKKILRGEIIEPFGGPKILFLDIETAPTLAYVYQKQVWKANIKYNQILSEWFILTFAYSWLGDDGVFSEKVSPLEAINEDDSRLLLQLWNILNEADIVVCHGGDYFDIPNINTRFVLAGLGPTTYYKQVDTLKIARKQFGFTHNSLGALAKVFGIDAKLETNFELWKACLDGNEKALGYMAEYNEGDVRILKSIYLKLRPWIKSHPNYGLYTSKDDVLVCPHCGGRSLEKDGGFYYTQTGKYPTYRCLVCGAKPRDRKSVSDINNKVVSIPGR